MLVPSGGGLATGLNGVHRAGSSVWIGWSGVATNAGGGADPLAEQWAELNCVPVPLSATEVTGFYERYCNRIVWPLFHSLLHMMPLRPGHWPLYERVNRRFATAVDAHCAPGDSIWVHDYQLMRVPALLRRRRPESRIGFFLHIPFPPVEIFAALPDREAILEGLLGADVVGFHTAAYLRNFAAAVLQILGVAVEVDGLVWRGRRIALGVFPMGVDARHFAERAASDEVSRLVAELRGSGGVRLIVGVDRLDYTKGIPRRLLAFEYLLHRHPELVGRVRLIQLGVPSRSDVPEYRRFRHQIDALVGRINGAFGTAAWTPVHYLVRSMQEDDLVALYRAADIMLVTPERDGMNLVAKEFVASRTDDDGVLVLSEFAGAAAELGEALQVNPYDIHGTADTVNRALMMAADERRDRMQGLRQRVSTFTAERWAADFLESLAGAGSGTGDAELGVSSPAALSTAVRRLRAAPHLTVLLDYDGTLVPFAPEPDLAVPDAGALALLERLARRPATEVHIVSGRSWESLERWLGALPLSLHAEHGLWSRVRGGAWERRHVAPLTRRAELRALLDEATARVPGSLVEEKSVGLAWHYRAAEPTFAARQGRDLHARLNEMLSNEPLEVLAGDKVLEIRPHGVDKGTIARRALRALPPGGLVLALGDDPTDEDLFAALPDDSVTVHVGAGASRASLRLAGVSDVRWLLATVAGGGPTRDAGAASGAR